jgi:hypothetical protein
MFNVRDYGATGDGTTDDTDGIQSAIVEAGKVGGGVVYFPSGTYLIRRNTHPHRYYHGNMKISERWGLCIEHSNVSLSGDGSCSILKRFDSINSGTAAVESTGYPIVHIGRVHSDDPRDQVHNISISNLHFCGDSAFHNKNGSNIEDMRTSIMARNAKYLDITGCIFSNIDSSAVYFRYPYIVNTTKCYNITIRHCRFTGVQPKTTVVGSDGMKRHRALLNAIVCSGVDYLTVSNNHFEWCDSCCIGSGTYWKTYQNESDTYIVDSQSALVSASLSEEKRTRYPRAGRNWIFSNNVCINSSDHVLLLSGTDITISGNTCTATSDLCFGALKVRGNGITITGNTITSDKETLNINKISTNITVTSNILTSRSDPDAGVIAIVSYGLQDYIIHQKKHSDWIECSVEKYEPMGNIIISNNTISCSPVTSKNDIGIRIQTSTKKPDNHQIEIDGIIISNNIFRNCKQCLNIINGLIANVIVSSNLFHLNDKYQAHAVTCSQHARPILRKIVFNGNTPQSVNQLQAQQTTPTKRTNHPIPVEHPQQSPQQEPDYNIPSPPQSPPRADDELLVQNISTGNVNNPDDKMLLAEKLKLNLDKLRL